MNVAGTRYSSLTGVARSSPTSAPSSAENTNGWVRAIRPSPTWCHRQRSARSRRRRAATIIREVETEYLRPGRHRIAGDNFVMFDAEPIVGELRPTVLQPQAPSAKPAALCEDHARCAGGGDLDTSAMIENERFFILINAFSMRPDMPG